MSRLKLSVFLVVMGFSVSSFADVPPASDRPEDIALCSAVKAAVVDTAAVVAAIQNGANPDALCHGHGTTQSALAFVLDKKQEAAALYLIEQGSKADLRNSHSLRYYQSKMSRGFTNFAKAACEGSPRILDAFVKRGADVNEAVRLTRQNQSPLYYALRCKNFENANFLIENGANIDDVGPVQQGQSPRFWKTDRNLTALAAAYLFGAPNDLIEKLLQRWNFQTDTAAASPDVNYYLFLAMQNNGRQLSQIVELVSAGGKTQLNLNDGIVIRSLIDIMITTGSEVSPKQRAEDLLILDFLLKTNTPFNKQTSVEEAMLRDVAYITPALVQSGADVPPGLVARVTSDLFVGYIAGDRLINRAKNVFIAVDIGADINGTRFDGTALCISNYYQHKYPQYFDVQEVRDFAQALIQRGALAQPCGKFWTTK